MQGNKSYTNNQLLAVFRANTRNAVELEKYLREKGAKNLKAQGRAPPALDPTDPDEWDRLEREEENTPPPQYTTAPPSRHATQSRQHGNGQSQHQDRVPEERSGGGWFSRKKQPDVERGDIRRREDEALPHLPNDARLPNDEPRRNKSALRKNRY
jgi:hypothetical protein